MSTVADFGFSFDSETGTVVSINDASTFDGASITDVKAVRILFGAVNRIETFSNNVTSLLAWTQYLLNQDTTINGVSYLSGDTIYLANDVDLGVGETATETGYYGERITWLPVDDFAEFAPSQTGYTTSDTIFSDNVFNVVYELYGNELLAGSIVAGTYIVKGTDGDFITIGSGSYYVGEVFTISSTLSFTGSSSVCPLLSIKTDFAFTDYQAYSVITSYLETFCDPYLVTNMQKLQFDFLQVNGIYQSLVTMGDQNYDVSPVNVQNLLNQINSYWSNLSSVT